MLIDISESCLDKNYVENTSNLKTCKRVVGFVCTKDMQFIHIICDDVSD